MRHGELWYAQIQYSNTSNGGVYTSLRHEMKKLDRTFFFRLWPGVEKLTYHGRTFYASENLGIDPGGDSKRILRYGSPETVIVFDGDREYCQSNMNVPEEVLSLCSIDSYTVSVSTFSRIFNPARIVDDSFGQTGSMKIPLSNRSYVAEMRYGLSEGDNPVMVARNMEIWLFTEEAKGKEENAE